MVRARCGYAWLGAVLGIAGSGALWGDAGVPGGYCRVAGEHEIPCTLLYAIALAESGTGSNGKGMRRPWPWTLNVAGRGHFYPSRRTAWQALNRLIARGERSIDIGLMQVNWRFHRDRLGNPWQALDPYHNLRVGAGILRDCFRRRHDWWAGMTGKRLPAGYGLVLAALTMSALPAQAEVTVIHDSGHTRPLAPYLEVLDEGAPETDSPLTPEARLGGADPRNLLPIRSPGLAPGPVQARTHDRPFSRPFFLLGSDERSRQWLVRHRERLRAIGAVGLLVQAETLDDLQAMAQLAAGLAVTPASGTGLAAALGLAHYPVLVTSRGIEQ